MKHFLYVCSAITTMLLAAPAFAQSSTRWTTSDQCKIVLQLAPVSPYVQKVLSRADAALAYSDAAQVDSDFLLPSWAAQVGSAWATLIADSQRLTIQSNDLAHNTACLHFDMTAIECKMDQVRNEMNEQLQRGSDTGILQLIDLLAFLNERFLQLSKGATDATYTDPTWGKVRSFDPPSTIFCCPKARELCTQTTTFDCENNLHGHAYVDAVQCGKECLPPAGAYDISAAMCPYDSDYAQPLLNGYGCDTDVLQPRTAFNPVNTEYQTLNLIMNQLNDYRTSAQQFLDVQQSIDALFNQKSTLPTPPQSRTHIIAVGCKQTGGVCGNDHTVHCAVNTDCANNDTCVFPTKICKQNRNLTCLTDNDCTTGTTNNGPCIDNDGKTVATTEARGPFSVVKNELQLLLSFLALRMEQGYSRELPDTLKYAQELSSDQSSALSERANEYPMFDTMRDSLRPLYRAWSRIQGGEEADTFAYATDPALEVANALSSLRTAVGDLARLVADKKNGLRSFVINYAYFLRRTCVYRTCNASLEESLKIAFADKCFPYTNGDYLSDTASFPRSTKCANDAGITVP